MATLAPVFSLRDAQAAGVRKDEVYALLKRGHVERIGRGVYGQPHLVDPAYYSLAAVSVACPEATLCLLSALVHHGLSDAIPLSADIALPRGTHRPAGFIDVAWHSFDASTFDQGRENITLDGGLTVGIYSAERTIIDCFRLRHLEGSDVAYEALRRWLRGRTHSPSTLLTAAQPFPKALPALHHALEVLL